VFTCRALQTLPQTIPQSLLWTLAIETVYMHEYYIEFVSQTLPGRATKACCHGPNCWGSRPQERPPADRGVVRGKSPTNSRAQFSPSFARGPTPNARQRRRGVRAAPQFKLSDGHSTGGHSQMMPLFHLLKLAPTPCLIRPMARTSDRPQQPAAAR